MKKIFLLLTLSFAYHVFSHAQPLQADSWKIKWNKKVILETARNNETANTRKIKAADLKKSYILEILYKEADSKKEKQWIRSFMFFDESDNGVIEKRQHKK